VSLGAFSIQALCRTDVPSGGFAAEKLILLFAAAVGAAEAAEEQHRDSDGNKNREDRSESKERMS